MDQRERTASPRDPGGSVKDQARALVVPLALLYAGVAAALAAVFLTARAIDLTVTDTLRDPIIVLEGSFGTGVISNLGVLVWTASAAAAALAAAALRRAEPHGAVAPLLAAAALTAVLVLDDLYLGHEIADQKLGIPEAATFSVYALGAAAIVWGYRSYWLRTEYLLALVALVLLATVAILDVTLVGNYPAAVVEDSLKFAGIATWSLFLARTAYRELGAALRAT